MDDIRRENLKQLLKSIEYMKSYLMKEYNYLGLNDEAIRRTTVYPMAKVKPFVVNDYFVMQFAYDGALPIYDKDLAYLNKVKHYYYLATFDSYDYEKMTLPLFDKAVIVFVHYFNYLQFSDLDNRNAKFIQDAIKLTGVIRDDNWENVWNVHMGYYDKERSHVQVYVVEQENLGDFINHLQKNHENMKIPDSMTPKMDKYEKASYMFDTKLQKMSEETSRLNVLETISLNIKHNDKKDKKNEQNSMDFW